MSKPIISKRQAYEWLLAGKVIEGRDECTLNWYKFKWDEDRGVVKDCGEAGWMPANVWFVTYVVEYRLYKSEPVVLWESETGRYRIVHRLGGEEGVEPQTYDLWEKGWVYSKRAYEVCGRQKINKLLEEYRNGKL